MIAHTENGGNGNGNGHKKHAGGAHPKYSPKVVELICKAVSKGQTYRHACALVGITVGTLCHWRNTKPEFSEALRKADAKFITRNLALIEKGAKRNWFAAAWLLERKFPQDFARREVIIEPGEPKPELSEEQQINRLRGLFGTVTTEE